MQLFCYECGAQAVDYERVASNNELGYIYIEKCFECGKTLYQPRRLNSESARPPIILKDEYYKYLGAIHNVSE